MIFSDYTARNYWKFAVNTISFWRKNGIVDFPTYTTNNLFQPRPTPLE